MKKITRAKDYPRKRVAVYEKLKIYLNIWVKKRFIERSLKDHLLILKLEI